MSIEQNSVDRDFIDNKIADKLKVEIFLVNGVKLVGTIYEQDSVSILASGKDGKQQLIYKRNISTIT